MHTPTRTLHTCWQLLPLFSRALDPARAFAKIACVELHVVVQPAMKLGSRSKVTSLRIDISCWILTCGKETRHSTAGDNTVSQCGVFALLVDVTVFTFSRALKFNFTFAELRDHLILQGLAHTKLFLGVGKVGLPSPPLPPKLMHETLKGGG